MISTLRWRPASSLVIAPLVGGVFSRREVSHYVQADRGPTYGVNASFKPLVGGTFETVVSAHYLSQSVDNLPSREEVVSVGLKGTVAGAFTSLSFQQNRTEKTYYLGKSEKPLLESKESWVRGVEVVSEATLPLHVGLRAATSWGERSVVYDTEGDAGSASVGFREMRGNYQRISLNFHRSWGAWAQMTLFYTYADDREDHNVDWRDQEVELGEMGATLGLRLTRSDSVSVQLYSGVTSFDTPGEDDFDDRDVKTEYVRGRWRHTFSPWLELTLKGRVHRDHQIYLFSEMSANNNVATTYHVESTVGYRPCEALPLEQSFHLSSNYLTYDWERAADSEVNNIFRSASSTSQLRYLFTSRLHLRLRYSYVREDYGQLLWWDEWVERVSWNRTLHRGDFSTTWSQGKLSIAPEIGYEEREDWSQDYSASRRLVRWVLSLGAEYPAGHHHRLTGRATRKLERREGGVWEATHYADVAYVLSF